MAHTPIFIMLMLESIIPDLTYIISKKFIFLQIAAQATGLPPYPGDPIFVMLMVMNPNSPLPGTKSPQEQTPQPGQNGIQPGPQNPYGFIINTPHPPKNRFLKPNSFRSRLLVIVGGGAILMIAIVLISSLITRSSKENATALVSLVAKQQEIVRVAGLGVVGSSDLLTQSWAETTVLSVGSQQFELKSYLTKRKTVITAPILLSKLDPQTTSAFTAATADNNFTEVFRAKLKTSLVTYEQNLKKSYDGAKGPTIKKILGNSYNSTATLLK